MEHDLVKGSVRMLFAIAVLCVQRNFSLLISKKLHILGATQTLACWAAVERVSSSPNLKSVEYDARLASADSAIVDSAEIAHKFVQVARCCFWETMCNYTHPGAKKRPGEERNKCRQPTPKSLAVSESV